MPQQEQRTEIGNPGKQNRCSPSGVLSAVAGPCQGLGDFQRCFSFQEGLARTQIRRQYETGQHNKNVDLRNNNIAYRILELEEAFQERATKVFISLAIRQKGIQGPGCKETCSSEESQGLQQKMWQNLLSGDSSEASGNMATKAASLQGCFFSLTHHLQSSRKCISPQLPRAFLF